MGEPSLRISVAPRQTVMPPKVTMKGGTLKKVTALPCRYPTRVPTAVAAASATTQPEGESIPSAFMTKAPDMPANASSEPTARSTPAVKMTKVMPTAMMP